MLQVDSFAERAARARVTRRAASKRSRGATIATPVGVFFGLGIALVVGCSEGLAQTFPPPPRLQILNPPLALRARQIPILRPKPAPAAEVASAPSSSLTPSLAPPASTRTRVHRT